MGILSRRILGSVLSVVLSLQPVLATAQSIVVDPASPPGAGRAGLTATQSGIAQINIAQPNGAGLSHNLFTQYGVAPGGLILNNATAITNTQLAGAVTGNPNLGGHSATVILNEVTGTSASALNGYTEVAGSGAGVVIANPNGISCAGCGFINTPRATLTTGKPNIGMDGSLTGFTVNQGNVAFAGAGGDFTQVPVLDIISRSVTLNAPVNGQAGAAGAINVVTGRNQVAYGTNQASALAADGSTAPLFAIDSSALGGMYAGRIMIDATEAGVGVNQQGTLAANAGQMTLSANGDLTNAGSIAGQTGAQVSAANITNTGTLGSAAGNAAIIATGNLNNDGKIASPGILGITAQGFVENSGSVLGDAGENVTALGGLTNSGQIGSVNGALVLTAGSLSNLTGAVIGAGPSLAITIAGTASNAGTIAASGGNLIFYAAALTNNGSATASAAADVVITGDLTNTGGVVGGTGLTLTATTLESSVGASLGAVSGDAGISIAGAASNSGTIAASAGDLIFTATSLGNGSTGSITGSDAVQIAVLDGLTNAGAIAAQTGPLTLTAETLFNQGAASGIPATGQIGAGTTLIATVAGNVTNGGAIIGDAGLTLTATTLENDAGGAIGAVAGLAHLGISGAVSNAGTIAASNGNLTFAAASLANSAAGSLTGSGAAQISTTAAIVNAGRIAGIAGDLTIDAASLTNLAAGQIDAGSLLTAALAGDTDNLGSFVGGNGLVLNAGTLENYAGGSIGALTGNASFAVTGASSNAGIIAASAGNLTLNAGSLSNAAAGNISSQDAASIVLAAPAGSNANTAVLTNAGMIAARTGALILQASSLSNLAGGAIGAGTTLTAAIIGDIGNSGAIIGSGGMALTAATLENTAGATLGAVANDASVTLSGGATNAGTISAAAGNLVFTAATLANSGSLTGHQAVYVTVTSPTPAGAAMATLLNSGIIAAQTGMLRLQAADLNNAVSGQIGSGTALTATLAGDAENSGSIVGGTGLTFNAATLENNAGASLGALAGSASITLTGATSNAGAIVAATGDVTLSAASLANTGNLFGGGAELLALAGALTNSGTIVAQTGALTINAGSLDNQRTGGIGAGAMLGATITGASINTGKLAGDGGVTLLLSAIDNTAGLIESADGDIAITAAGVTNTGGAIQATNGSVGLNAASLTGGGALSAADALTLTLTSNFTNAAAGSMTAGSVVFSTTGDLANGGQIAATDGDASLTAGNITNTGILAASQLLSINGASLTNSDTGLVYGSQGITANITGAIDNNAGAILADTGALALTADSIDNVSGLIQSTAGDVTITANTVTNEIAGGVTTNPSVEFYDITYTPGTQTNNITGVTTALATPAAAAFANDQESQQFLDKDAHIAVLYPLNGAYEYIDFNDSTGDTVTITGYRSTNTPNGAPALISAGGNLTFNNADVTNNGSDIVAGGNVSFNGGSLDNIGYSSQANFYLGCPGGTKGRGGGCRSDEPADASLDPPVGLPEYFFTPSGVAETELWFTANLPAGVSSIVSAGGSITGNLTGAINNTTIVANASASQLAGYSINPVAISASGALNSNAQSLSGVTGSGVLDGVTANGTLTGIANAPANLPGITSGPGIAAASTGGAIAFAGATAGSVVSALAGGNALFVTDTTPGAHYLIESRYQFSEAGLLGSSYLLTQLGINPAQEPPFLGDAYFDTRYIDQQILQDTGGAFLAGYASQGDEMAALYNNATADAASLGLTLGTALTENQIAALGNDLIWYVDETVDSETVLVPVLYLSPKDAALAPNGALIAGNNISLAASSVTNTDGTIQAADTLALQATNGSIQNLASISNLALLGGTEQLDNGGGKISAGSDMLLAATGSITSLGSTITAGGNLTAVGQSLNIAAATLTTADTLAIQNGVITYNATTNAGSTVSSGANLLLAATGGNVNIAASAITAAGSAALQASNDVNITTATDNADLGYTGHKSGFLSSSNNTTTSDSQTVVQSTVTGANVAIAAGRNVNITGSNVAGLSNVAIAAGNAVNIGASTQTDSSSDYASHHGFGAAVSGAGISVGAFGKSINESQSSTTQIGSNIGAVNGNLTITAGAAPLTAAASTLYAGNDLTLIGPSVTLNDALNTESQSVTQKQNFSGLNVSLGGAAGAVANGAIAAANAAQSGNSTLAALQGAEGVEQGYLGYSSYASAVTQGNSTVAAHQGGKPGGVSNAEDQAAQIDISLTASGSKSTSTESATQAVGDTLTAGHDLIIDATSGDVTATAASIAAGNDASIAAAKNILLQSGQNTTSSATSSHSSSGSVGAFAGAGGGYGVQASGSLAESNGNGASVSQVNTTVNAGNTLSLTSGGNTTLAGAQGSAPNIIANTGGNLNIISEQNTSSYHYNSDSGGASVSVGAAGGSGSGSFANTSIKDNAASVGAGQQSGLTASRTLNAIIAGNTNLDGGILSAPAGSLTTGSLTAENIQNQYASSGSSLSLSTSANGYMPSGVLPGGSSTSGSGSGTTYGTVSSGITLNSGSGTPASLNRNTTIANGAVNDNFNLTKTQTQLETQQIGAQLFGQAANEAAGYLIQKQGWGELSTQALLLHGAIGAVEGAISGGGALNSIEGSAVGSIAGTAITQYLENHNVSPYSAEGQLILSLASSAVGAAAGEAAGGSAGSLAGATGAANSTLYNSFGHVTTENQLIQELAQCNVSVPCSQSIIQSYEKQLNDDVSADEFVSTAVGNVLGFLGAIGDAPPGGQMGGEGAGLLGGIDAELDTVAAAEADVIGPTGYVESLTVRADQTVELSGPQTLADGTVIPSGSIVTPTSYGYSIAEPGGETIEESASNLPEESPVPAPNTGGEIIGSAGNSIYSSTEPASELFPQLDGINPSGATNNCTACANVVYDRLTGANPTATAGDTGYGNQLSLDAASFSDPGTVSEVTNYMESLGNGQTRIVTIQTGPNTAHALDVTNQNGTVYFIDGQSGQIVTPSPGVEIRLGYPSYNEPKVPWDK